MLDHYIAKVYLVVVGKIKLCACSVGIVVFSIKPVFSKRFYEGEFDQKVTGLWILEYILTRDKSSSHIIICQEVNNVPGNENFFVTALRFLL